MPEHGVRARHSQCPFQILICDELNGILSGATAFFFCASDAYHYLITNRHNVTGKHNITGDYLPSVSPSRLPLQLQLKLATLTSELGPDGRPRFAIIPHRLQLYEQNNLRPVWREHPLLKHACDVVAIRFPRPQTLFEHFHVCANRISELRTPIKPGNTVFVIGFPSNLSIGFGLPIWKSGYIASEPFYPVKLDGQLQAFGGLAGGTELPAFFIDCQTRRGMSGAPIFSQFIGNWSLRDPYEELDPGAEGFWERDDVALAEADLEFVGIYSGRSPGPDKDDVALGLCWRADVIDAICVQGVEAEHPHC